MSKEYESLACKIVEYVGGKDNVNDVYHCQTRLRFKLADEEKADQKKLEDLDGVSKVMISGGVYQVIIGTHVKYVFEEIEKLIGPRTAESGDRQEKSEKKSVMGVIIDFVSGTFQPVIPALSGAGMVKALLALLVVFGLISTESQTYYILNFFADGVFYFLPIMLAFTEAQKLKCNPILAASVAAIMLHPNWGTLVAAGEAVHLFGVVPLRLTLYTSSVIPIILVILVQSYVERWLEKHIPNAVKLVFVPMLTFLVMGTLGLAVLGPIGSVAGEYLGVFFNFLSENASWAPAVLVGAFLPIMVMFGLHNGVAPLGVMQMADLGYDSIFGPGCVCSNIAQGTAALVVAIRTKEAKIKQLSVSGGITALMGITEPVLYGVNLPKKYPLVAAMIGGGCGGLFAGLTHTHRFATGSSGLPAVLLYIGDDSIECLINICIALVISAVVTAVVTYLLSLKFETGISAEKGEEMPEVLQIETGKEIRREHGEVKAPLKGKLMTLEQIGDGVFSEGVLGQGCGILPEEGKVYAPFEGTVVSVADTGHAIGIESEEGIQLLIHVGLDTVALQGEGFSPCVKEGDKVTCGQKLMDFELEKIAEKYPVVTAVIVTNSDDYETVAAGSPGTVSPEDTVLKVR